MEEEKSLKAGGATAISPTSKALINSEFLYTRSVPKPLIQDTIKETRFKIRLIQLILGIASFTGLAIATVRVNYAPPVLGSYGVDFMCLTSLSSCFLYLVPAFLNVPPHRHPRFSRIEVIVDLIYCGLWIAASLKLASSGNCPRKFLDIDVSEEDISCLSWNICFGLGFLSALTYIFTFSMGTRDIWTHGWFGTVEFIGTRGNWIEDD
ncbi:hypothetical protein HK099_005279 [Clydaea vesicula]|uniref:MARVEL domain-containing protein n=1 Tax=Clydaea vesicula TaxID=447962 RepID=A0AAD5TZ26_9FUNG|nr:hypothetical protein HK099_005279 [Clydaea vesicula]KAJ3395658.1 hypothetical protein HDU92_005284 [Lobulomyces angularis]